MSSLLRRYRAFRRGERGASVVEFAMIAPIFLGMAFTFYDFGAFMVREVTLSAAVDRTVRDLRINRTVRADGRRSRLKDYRERICGQALMLSDCENTLTVELIRIRNPNHIPSAATECVNRDPNAGPERQGRNAFQAGDLVMFRVCGVAKQLFPVLTPGSNLENDDGDILIRASTIYVNE